MWQVGHSTQSTLATIESIVATVRQSGHRLFALGVGSAPAESLLRELAEVSGGACEMVSPNQSMQQAVGRLLERMRKSCAVETHLEFAEEVLYESAYSTRWRTRFHADGGQHSTVIADTVPR